MEKNKLTRNEISFEERQEIQRLFEKGYKPSSIAQILDRPRQTINTEIRKNGGKENYNAIKAQQLHDFKRSRKSSAQFKSFTAEEKQKAVEMIKEGRTQQEIAKILKRSRSSLSSIFTSEILQTCIQSQEDLNKRISNLEFQSEIIIDKLKEIYEFITKN